MGLHQSRRHRTASPRRLRVAGDAGVSQSAFVAFMLVATMAITSSLVAFGPTVGNRVTHFWVCNLQGGSCPAGLPPVAGGAPTLHTNADGDGVLSVDVADPASYDAAVKNFNDAKGDQKFSDYIKQQLRDHPLNLPGNTPAWADFDAELQNGPDGPQVVIPKEELNTNLWGWVAQLIAGASAALAGTVSWTLCLAAFPGPAGLAPCGAVAGFMGTFTWTAVAKIAGGQGVRDSDVWLSALAAGIVGAAIGGGFTGWLVPWAENGARPALVGLGQYIYDSAASLARWGGGAAANAIRATGTFIMDCAGRIGEALQVAMQRAGLVSAPAPGLVATA